MLRLDYHLSFARTVPQHLCRRFPEPPRLRRAGPIRKLDGTWSRDGLDRDFERGRGVRRGGRAGAVAPRKSGVTARASTGSRAHRAKSPSAIASKERPWPPASWTERASPPICARNSPPAVAEPCAGRDLARSGLAVVARGRRSRVAVVTWPARARPAPRRASTRAQLDLPATATLAEEILATSCALNADDAIVRHPRAVAAAGFLHRAGNHRGPRTGQGRGLGFHPTKRRRMVLGLPGVRAVARRTGVLEILRRAGVPLAGSRPSSWFGRRPDRGRPLSILLSQKGVDATVTLCHTRTRTSALHARSGRRWSWPRAGRGR